MAALVSSGTPPVEEVSPVEPLAQAAKKLDLDDVSHGTADEKKEAKPQVGVDKWVSARGFSRKELRCIIFIL